MGKRSVELLYLVQIPRFLHLSCLFCNCVTKPVARKIWWTIFSHWGLIAPSLLMNIATESHPYLFGRRDPRYLILWTLNLWPTWNICAMKQTLWVVLRDSEAIRDFAYLILSRSIISASFILFTCFQRRQAPNSEMKVTQEKDKRLFTITKRKEEALLKLHQIFAKEQALIETTFHMRLTEHELLAQQWTTQAEKIAFERRIQEQEKDEKHEKHKMTRQMTLAEQMLQEQADNLQSRNSFAVQSYKFMFDFWNEVGIKTHFSSWSDMRIQVGIDVQKFKAGRTTSCHRLSNIFKTRYVAWLTYVFHIVLIILISELRSCEERRTTSHEKTDMWSFARMQIDLRSDMLMQPEMFFQDCFYISRCSVPVITSAPFPLSAP